MDLEKQKELKVLVDIVLQKDFKYFAALTLDLLQVGAPRREELKVLRVPEVLSVMFLWVGESRVLLVGPKISLFECNEVSSSGVDEYEEEELECRWCELVFKAGKDLVDESNVDVSSSWWLDSWEENESSDE